MALRSYFMAERERLEPLYRRARYRVELDTGSVELTIGERSPALDRHLESTGASRWAILTACNPGSVRLPEPENRRRTAELARRLGSRGWSTCPAAGIDPDGRWPDEAGYLVAGVAHAALVALAAELGQAAIVVGRRGGAAELLWIDAAAQAPPDVAL
jgi:hypothetical protein